MKPLPAVLSSVVLLLTAGSGWGCRRATPAPAGEGARPSDPAGLLTAASGATNPSPAWLDATASTGLDFLHWNGMSGQWYMVEMDGPGAALFDFDQDGDLDLFLVQGTVLGPDHPLPGAPASQAGHAWHHRLYRNDLTRGPDGRPQVHWTDISGQVGLKNLPSDYGMGVAVGDYDNDGFPDLYVSNFGPNRLLKNDRGRHFVDVTSKVGGELGDPHWSLSATWFDFDRDGFLDLFCANYLDFTFENHRVCTGKSGAPDYCGPQVYPRTHDRLWRNRGDGTFEDVTAPAGFLARQGAGMGVVAADFDGDGWQDLLVANDLMANFLWVNQRDGTFKEQALERGCAVNGMGAAEANMGVVAADFDEDGDEDIVITHLDGEKNTLFQNWNRGHFTDVSAVAGIDGPTRPFTGFGLMAFDYDNDGILDLISANGAVKVNEAQRKAGVPLPMLQHVQLFRGLGRGRFSEVTNEPALKVLEIGRGLAVGDVDNDGDVDVVLANNNGPARVVLNQRGSLSAWLGIDLWLGGAGGGRPAYGAIAVAELSDGRTLRRRCAADGSYVSASDPRIIFGLGDIASGIAIRKLVVTWPNGRRESWTGLDTGKYHRLNEGSGQPVVEKP